MMSVLLLLHLQQDGCLIYNSTAVTGFTTDRAVCAIVNFGGDKTVTSGTFTIQFPASRLPSTQSFV